MNILDRIIKYNSIFLPEYFCGNNVKKGRELEIKVVPYFGENFIKHRSLEKFNSPYDIKIWINRKKNIKAKIDVKKSTLSSNKFILTKVKKKCIGLHVFFEPNDKNPKGCILTLPRVKNTNRSKSKIQKVMMPLKDLSSKNLQKLIINIDEI